MNTQNFTQKTIEAIQNAQNIASENENQALMPYPVALRQDGR